MNPYGLLNGEKKYILDIVMHEPMEWLLFSMYTQSKQDTEGCILNLGLSYNNNTYVISNVYGL